MQIGFVTCVDLSKYFYDKKQPLYTHDDAVVAEYLQSSGHQVMPVVWGEDPAKLQDFDVLVIRSPWDYMDSQENSNGFFEWLKKIEKNKIATSNTFALMSWNYDKRYLEDLESVEIPVIPTDYLLKDDSFDRCALNNHLNVRGPFVLKPCVSAGARDTFYFKTPADIEKMSAPNTSSIKDFSIWRGNREFMIQPFVDSISEVGEWSLVFFGGEYSHAVLKRPPVGGWLVQDEYGGSVVSLDPPSEVKESACFASNKLFSHSKKWFGKEQHPLYARYDLVFYESRWCIGEIEMIEPELFFLQRSDAGNTVNKRACELFLKSIESLQK